MALEHRGVAVLGNDGLWHPHIVAVAIASLTTDRYLDVHGPDAWDVDASLAIIGLVVRREEYWQPPTNLGSGQRRVVRYYGARDPSD